LSTPELLQDLRRDEGLRLDAYQDAGGVWTIGVGHTGPEVRHGLCWTEAQCEAALARDVASVERGLTARIPWWLQLGEARQDVLANMAFNLGVEALCSWTHTLAAVRAEDYALAAERMLGSEPWRSQVGRRAERLAEQMRTGRRVE
jgi:lysozyme